MSTTSESQDILRGVHNLIATAQTRLEELEASDMPVPEGEELWDVQGVSELVKELADRLGPH